MAASLTRMFSGQRLRAARTAARISQTQLANQIGCTLQAIYYYERGRSVPGGNALVRIIDTLGCELDDLLEEERASEASS